MCYCCHLIFLQIHEGLRDWNSKSYETTVLTNGVKSLRFFCRCRTAVNFQNHWKMATTRFKQNPWTLFYMTLFNTLTPLVIVIFRFFFISSSHMKVQYQSVFYTNVTIWSHFNSNAWHCHQIFSISTSVDVISIKEAKFSQYFNSYINL